MIDEIPEAGIALGDDLSSKGERSGIEDGYQAAFLADPELWANWEDQRLYDAEVAIRGWMERMSENPKWARTNAKCRRYTFSMVFELITGERYDQKRHMRYVHAWTMVLSYYSSRVQKGGSINGRPYTKTIYNLSPKRLSRPPLSLRLRFEWLAERGVKPTEANMRNPQNDILRPGHARNPRTDERMRQRREEARARYNERYRDRDH